MTERSKSKKDLLLEIEELKSRLEEAEETLRAIRQGEVDGIIGDSAEGDRIYTLHGAEQPYRVFFEAMNEGAVTMTTDGTILYCNRRFADLAQVPLEKVTGMSFLEFIAENSRQAVRALLSKPGLEKGSVESSLKAEGNKIVPVNISANPLKTKDIEAVCAVITDLSELFLMRRIEDANQKLARINEELMASERTLRDARRAALNLMEDAVTARKQVEDTNAELRQEVAERKRTEEALEASVREKDVLLKEVHHRVKNNLQVISSLMSLQANVESNAALAPVFNDMRERVHAMALVHEKLYQSADLAGVNFAEYARSLVTQIWNANGPASASIHLKLDMDPVTLTLARAVPCGLILNELMTNALKHAFPGGAAGEVTVSLRKVPSDRVMLKVSDNGAGLPPGTDWRQSRSLGLHLVRLLAMQLSGLVEVRSSSGTGTQFELSLPIEEPK